MPNTYSQIYLHIIFAVKGRESVIGVKWEEELYKYITGIVQNKGNKMLAINGMPDHIHFVIGYNPNVKIPDLVREIKKASNKFIKEKKFVRSNFQWQEGYGVFSYSKSGLDSVIKYVRNQKEHHRKKTFREEYTAFLNKFEVDFSDEYLFVFLD